MLGHIRRHQKWLWVLIAGATIISFVIFLDPTTGRRGGGRSIFGGRTGDYGSINGRAISPEEFGQIVRHEAGIEHLFALGGLSGGLVAPREAEALYRQENEQLATEVVLFPASNYLAGVEVTPAALGQFYTNNMAQYRVPERVQVGYVKFEITNFLAEADQLLAQET